MSSTSGPGDPPVARMFGAMRGGKGVAIRLAVCVAIIAAASWLLDVERILNYIDGRLIWAIVLLQGPVTLGLLVYAYRHAWLASRPPPPFYVALASVVLSNAFAIIMPARTSEFIKATYLRKNAGIPFSQGMATVVVERLFDLIVVLAIGAWALSVTALHLNAGIAIAAPFIAITGTFAAIRWHQRLTPLFRFIPRRLHGFVIACFEAAAARTGPKQMLINMALTVTAWLFHLSGTLVFFEVQPVYDVSVATAAAVFAAALLASAIPALPSGFGAYEAAVAVILVNYGASWEQGLTLGFALHLAQLVLALVLAPVILVAGSTGITDLLRDAMASLRNTEP